MDYSEKSPEFEKFMDKYLEKQKELYRFHVSVLGTIVTLIIAALGLISALAWDEALHEIFSKMFGTEGIGAKLSYAIVITVIAAIVSISLGRIVNKKSKK